MQSKPEPIEQKAAQVEVDDVVSIASRDKGSHGDNVFGVIILYVFITVSLGTFRCSLFKYFVMLEALKTWPILLRAYPIMRSIP